MFVFEFLFFTGLVYLAISIGWLFLLTCGSWLHKEKVDRNSPLLNLAVVIPAHNEELQISRTIKNIQNCDYPKELLKIIVIADNCTDNTANEARLAGVEVVERFHESERGKGQALDWFLQSYQPLYEQLDGISFVDADVSPDRKMFKELSYSLSHPEVRIVQGFNGVANPYENWRTALNTAAFNVFNHLRMAGNDKLFGSSNLKGLGMAFETSILKEYGWPAHSVVEDTEFTLMLLKEKIAVHYNPAAIITSEMASKREQADGQRQRWEGGRFSLAREVLPDLLKNLISGEFRYLYVIMDLFILPLSLLAVMLLCWIGLTIFFFPNYLTLLLVLTGVLFFYVASGQFQRQASIKLWAYLLMAPFFILWKLLIYIQMISRRHSSGWVRTLRKAEMRERGGVETMKKSRNEEIVAGRMEKRGLRKQDIAFFLSAWRNMHQEETKVNWNDITPATADQVFSLPVKDSREFVNLHKLGVKNMSKCAIVKLNGGRATSMGGTIPKCMVDVKDGKNFLDIVMGQIMAANDRHHIEMPLVLMNSFFTDHVTEKIVGRTPLIIMNFIQNEYPRIREDSLMPMDTGTDEDWCPAGHGDFFSSIDGSGLLDSLLDLGLRYAFISNIDNLSAGISPVILGQMVAGGHDFMMEVTRKTAADIKGGAPVWNNGTLSLLEIAQVPLEKRPDFQNIDKFHYFNTNNLWIDLRALKKLTAENRLNLPIIQNRKNICGTDIIQIETAMGAGLQCFSNPGLVEVARSRFTPIKKMEDLSVLQSDLYILNEDYQIQKSPEKHVDFAA